MKRQLKMMLLLLACIPFVVKAQEWLLGGNPFIGPDGTIISNYFGTNPGNAQGVRMGTVGVPRMFMQGTAGGTTGFIGIGNDFTNPRNRLHQHDNGINLHQFTNNNVTPGGVFNNQRGFTVGLNPGINAGHLGTNGRNAVIENHGVDDQNGQGGRIIFRTVGNGGPSNNNGLRTRAWITANGELGDPNPSNAGGFDGIRVHTPGLTNGSANWGYLDLWGGVSNTTHIQWGPAGRISGNDLHFQFRSNMLGFWFNSSGIDPLSDNSTSAVARYVYHTEGTETARMIGNDTNPALRGFMRFGVGTGTDVPIPTQLLPRRRVEIVQADNAQLRLTHNQPDNTINTGTYTDIGTTTLGDLAIFPFENTNPRNVGIGVATPTNKVDINGDLRIRQIANNDALTRVLVADNNGVVHWRNASSLGGLVTADNGLSKNTPTNVQLGQLISAAGNPARLLDNREVPLNGNNLVFTGSSTDQSINNIGIGLTTPHAKLDVYNDNGSVAAPFGASYTGIRSTVVGNTVVGPPGGQRNTGVLVNVTGEHDTEYGVHVTADGNGVFNYGVLSYAHQGNAQNVGVKGVASGLSGGVNCGVWGEVQNCRPNFSYGVYGKACVTPGSYAGYFDGEVSATNYLTHTSDQMFKTNIDTIANVKNIISQLKPRTFFYDTVTYSQFNFSSRKQYGLIAQHVETVLPELVKIGQHMPVYDSTGTMVKPAVTYKELNYNAFIAILIAGMQKQQAELDSIKSLLGMSRVSSGGSGSTTSYVKPQHITLSNLDALVLDQNVPNPFEENTLITYRIPENIQSAYIIFYDQNGRVINKADITTRGEGKLQVYGSQLSKGIYTYSLVADGKVIDTKKMVKQ